MKCTIRMLPVLLLLGIIFLLESSHGVPIGSNNNEQQPRNKRQADPEVLQQIEVLQEYQPDQPPPGSEPPPPGPFPNLPMPLEKEKTAVSAVTGFLPMIPMVMESVSGSLGNIMLQSMPQMPMFTNLNNMAQVVVSPFSSVTTGFFGNSLQALDDIMPGIHSLHPIAQTIPGFSKLINQAITHPSSFLLNPDSFSVPPLRGGGQGYGQQQQQQQRVFLVPNQDGKGQRMMVLNPRSSNSGYGYQNNNQRYPFHQPTSDINVEQIMGEGIQRILGLGAFFGNCPMGTIRLTTGGCQSIINAG